MDKLCFAAVQMKARLGDVDNNIDAARRLAKEAFREGADWVILPEFFTSAMGFHPKMHDVALPLEGRAMQMLKDLSREHNGVVGGSYIAVRGMHSYNTFVLALPDGTTLMHDKDQPTMWENCYYQGGTDEGILETPVGRTGVAMCWEFIRTRTVRRLLGRVNLVVGGSCWWTLPKKRLPGFPPRLHDLSQQIMAQTPSRFARLLGAPVVHAAHAGDFEGKLPFSPGFLYRSYYLGETQIVDETGRIMARMKREDGEGFVTAELDLSKKHEPTESVPDGFWIPELPRAFRLLWIIQNLHGRRYYRRMARGSIR
jgi:N-carbamoylputrescine amidase